MKTVHPSVRKTLKTLKTISALNVLCLVNMNSWTEYTGA